MRNSQRIVFDTNVLVSAFLFPDSLPGRLVFRPRTEMIPLMSVALLGELGAVLAREKFEAYISASRRMSLLAAFASRCERVELTITIHTCRDPRDNHLLELAFCGRAHAVVSGDKDLLVLDPFQGIRILRAVDFIDKFL